jgi:phosphoglycerate dehydrogenase-like enzyme
VKVVCADGFNGDRALAGKAFALLADAGHEFSWTDEPINGDHDWLARLDGADAVIALLDFPTPLVEQLPTLKLISFAGTGTEQYVDVPLAARSGVTVCNVPAYAENAVAEHALALLLGVAKRLVAGDRTVHDGRFDHKTPRELRGAQLGVIGAGPIAGRMLELGSAIGMRTVAWTRSPDAERAARLNTTFVELDELMRTSDAVSVHLPHHADTEGLLSAEMLELLPAGAIVINTGRAAVVDNRKLAEMIAAGRILGAGIDVFDQEPPPLDDPIIAAAGEESILSPHVGWDTPQALEKLYEVAAENVVAFAADAPQNVVTP